MSRATQGGIVPLTTGKTRWQAESNTPLTTLLANLNPSPSKPPPLTLGSGLHLSFGRLTFTKGTGS